MLRLFLRVKSITLNRSILIGVKATLFVERRFSWKIVIGESLSSIPAWAKMRLWMWRFLNVKHFSAHLKSHHFARLSLTHLFTFSLLLLRICFPIYLTLFRSIDGSENRKITKLHETQIWQEKTCTSSQTHEMLLSSANKWYQGKRNSCNLIVFKISTLLLKSSKKLFQLCLYETESEK